MEGELNISRGKSRVSGKTLSTVGKLSKPQAQVKEITGCSESALLSLTFDFLLAVFTAW